MLQHDCTFLLAQELLKRREKDFAMQNHNGDFDWNIPTYTSKVFFDCYWERITLEDVPKTCLQHVETNLFKTVNYA